MNVACPACQTIFRVDPERVPDPGVRARCSVCGGMIAISTNRGWDDDFADVGSASAAEPSAGRIASRAVAGARTAASVESPSAVTVEHEPMYAERDASTPNVDVPRTATPVIVAAPIVGPSTPVADARPRATVPPAHSPIATGARPSRPTPPRVPPFSPARRVPPATGGTSARPAAPARSLERERRSPTTVEPALDVATPTRTPTPTPDMTPSTSGSTGTERRPINPFLANDPNARARRLARALVSDMIAYHPAKREEGLRAGSLKQLFREEIRKSYEEYVDQVGQELAESTTHFQDALNDVLADGKKIF